MNLPPARSSTGGSPTIAHVGGVRARTGALLTSPKQRIEPMLSAWLPPFHERPSIGDRRMGLKILTSVKLFLYDCQKIWTVALFWGRSSHGAEPRRNETHAP
jgi:hypothetical protein